MGFRTWEKETINLPDKTSQLAVCPVIVSASRATDIPAFFAEWFRNRLDAGYLVWLNPFNTKQIQYISFNKTRVLVFWSKNPKPLIPHLSEIDAKGINYYFQFTLNDYEREGLEPHVPSLQKRIETFQILSKRLGRKRVIWRFDPLILTDGITIESLLDRISNLANQLRNYTEKLVISFADINMYKKVQYNLKRANVNYSEFTPSLMAEFAERLQLLNRDWGLNIATCAESIDLERYDIKHNRCIDDNLMIELFENDSPLMNFLGYRPDLFSDSTRPYIKDKGQRKECGCIVSKDIGMYDTCSHFCKYCYANTSLEVVKSNFKKHNPNDETLVKRIIDKPL